MCNKNIMQANCLNRGKKAESEKSITLKKHKDSWKK